MFDTRPTTSQFKRLASLGVTDTERALLAQRGHDRVYIDELIASAARWPLGPGALRYYRLFHEYPRGAVALFELEQGDQDAITAWQTASRLPGSLDAVYLTADWPNLAFIADAADRLADLARAERVNAVQNPAIAARIEHAGVRLCGYLTAARAEGRLGAPDYSRHAAPVPERIRRACRDWRALASRQAARVAYRNRLRRGVGWR